LSTCTAVCWSGKVRYAYVAIYASGGHLCGSSGKACNQNKKKVEKKQAGQVRLAQVRGEPGWGTSLIRPAVALSPCSPWHWTVCCLAEGQMSRPCVRGAPSKDVDVEPCCDVNVWCECVMWMSDVNVWCERVMWMCDVNVWCVLLEVVYKVYKNNKWMICTHQADLSFFEP